MYSIHGTIDIIVDGETESQCDHKYYQIVQGINKFVTQLDIDEEYKAIEEDG